MVSKNPDDQKRDDRLPGETNIARIYHDAGNELPPLALDAKILAEARRNITTPNREKSKRLRWALPLSSAAVVILAVGVVLIITSQNMFVYRVSNYSSQSSELATVSPATGALHSDEGVDPLARTKRNAEADPKRSPESDIVQEKESRSRFEFYSLRPQSTEDTQAMQAFNAPEVGKTIEAEDHAAALSKNERETTQPAGTAESQSFAEAPTKILVDKNPPRAVTPPIAMEGSHFNISAAEGMGENVPAADVISVEAGGELGRYEFKVTIRSADTGCQEYVDWWEVVGDDGQLLYRQILLHSHVGQKPFSLSGGPVPIQADTVVWVRAHMNTLGYSGYALKGTVRGGFTLVIPPSGFATELAKQVPLPSSCTF